ncbi:hypothetical protein [Methylobacterium sp. CM6244]
MSAPRPSMGRTRAKRGRDSRARPKGCSGVLLTKLILELHRDAVEIARVPVVEIEDVANAMVVAEEPDLDAETVDEIDLIAEFRADRVIG